MGKTSLSKRCRRFVFALLLSAAGCPADSIHVSGTFNPGSPPDLVFSDDPTGSYQGYFSEPGFVTPLDDPAFALLGMTPGWFLFTPNTMFAFHDTPVVSVLSAWGGPTGGVNGSSTQVLSFALRDNGSHSDVPEPRPFYAAATGVMLLALCLSRGGRRSPKAR
ncbi:MAG: hypothetical protein M3N54_11610 [Acidobacteriota bacterium]|nr:hypothetical protein [Acidobacteriota bacterium]